MNRSEIRSGRSLRSQPHSKAPPGQLWSAVTESRVSGTELPLSYLGLARDEEGYQVHVPWPFKRDHDPSPHR